MIAPDTVADIRAEHRFDLVVAALIGAIAVLAAILAVVQVDTNQQSFRAQERAASLAADLSARLQTTGQIQQKVAYVKAQSLALSLQGTAREIEGLAYKDEGAEEVGHQEVAAAAKLSDALDATMATSGGRPLDPYTAGMLNASIADLYKEVDEQNRQVDLANLYGDRNAKSILGLSFLALAGVLAGLGAVLREGRAGWFTLFFSAGMAAAAGVMAVLSIM